MTPGLRPDAFAEHRKEALDRLAALKQLDDDGRRAWLSSWMARHNLTAANQAAPLFGLTRQAFERLVYEQKVRRAPSDHVLLTAVLWDLLAER